MIGVISLRICAANKTAFDIVLLSISIHTHRFSYVHNNSEVYTWCVVLVNLFWMYGCCLFKSLSYLYTITEFKQSSTTRDVILNVAWESDVRTLTLTVFLSLLTAVPYMHRDITGILPNDKIIRQRLSFDMYEIFIIEDSFGELNK